jgi:hypothetical protein
MLFGTLGSKLLPISEKPTTYFASQWAPNTHVHTQSTINFQEVLSSSIAQILISYGLRQEITVQLVQCDR